MSKLTGQNFKCEPRERDKIQFAEIQIEKTGNVFHVHQTTYIAKLINISEAATLQVSDR